MSVTCFGCRHVVDTTPENPDAHLWPTLAGLLVRSYALHFKLNCCFFKPSCKMFGVSHQRQYDEWQECKTNAGKHMTVSFIFMILAELTLSKLPVSIILSHLVPHAAFNNAQSYLQNISLRSACDKTRRILN